MALLLTDNKYVKITQITQLSDGRTQVDYDIYTNTANRDMKRDFDTIYKDRLVNLEIQLRNKIESSPKNDDGIPQCPNEISIYQDIQSIYCNVGSYVNDIPIRNSKIFEDMGIPKEYLTTTLIPEQSGTTYVEVKNPTLENVYPLVKELMIGSKDC